MADQKPNQYIFPALFDVRPVNQAGDLDVEKIRQVKEVLNLRNAQSLAQIEFSREKNVLGAVKKASLLSNGEKKKSARDRHDLEVEKDKPIKISTSINHILPPQPLSREEILAELERINQRDDLLEAAQVVWNPILVREINKKPRAKTKTVKRPSLVFAPVEAADTKTSGNEELIETESDQPEQSEIFPPKEEVPPETAAPLSQDSKLKQESWVGRDLSALNDFYFHEVKTVSAKEYFNFSPFNQSEIKRPGRKIYFKPLISFVAIGVCAALIVPVLSWVNQGLDVENEAMASGLSAYQNLLKAQEALGEFRWQDAEHDFDLANLDFGQVQTEVKKINQIALTVLKNLPGGAKVASGARLVKIGGNLAQAGQKISAAVSQFSFENLLDPLKSAVGSDSGSLENKEGQISLTDKLVASQGSIREALASIGSANQELGKLEIDALPQEIQDGVKGLKEKLPLVEEILGTFSEYSDKLLEILGHNNPRRFLLVFQNNGEIRATGGFIGSYGLLTLDKGNIKELVVDDVFNVDGQLYEKIIPPRPIQKISTAWSMHDANWFADFPTSAQKIAWFYEKTGGPTVDGVMSLTPTVVEQILGLTGPIDMPEYGITLDQNNFIEAVQYKVEVDYDKTLNQPKKILADFAPKFIKKINELNLDQRKTVLKIIFDGFKQKHILAYFINPSLEELAINEGWSGELLKTEKDYLSVVSSNINGFKTDKVVKEDITHRAEIQSDGSIVVDLTIRRKHEGGNAQYEWFNKVNADYLRVYLPLGAELIDAGGQTVEKYSPAIDYEKSGFKSDPLVASVESSMTIDAKTGTEIFTETGKTVFGNWVYVSPGKEVVLSYKYKLPFKIDLTKGPDSYSLLVQKQSGSLGSGFSHQLKFPADWQVSFKYPEAFSASSNQLNYSEDLGVDRFVGATFAKE